MTYTKEDVSRLAIRIMKTSRPLVSSTFRDVEAMAEGDRLDDGMGGWIRDTYYPNRPDEFFQEVIWEVRRLHTEDNGGL